MQQWRQRVNKILKRQAGVYSFNRLGFGADTFTRPESGLSSAGLSVLAILALANDEWAAVD